MAFSYQRRRRDPARAGTSQEPHRLLAFVPLGAGPCSVQPQLSPNWLSGPGHPGDVRGVVTRILAATLTYTEREKSF